MKAKRRYADGDLVSEGANENIGDDTRLRALEFLKGLRGSGEAAPSTDADTLRAARGRASEAPAKSKAEPMPVQRQKMSADDMLKDTPTPSRSMPTEESPGAGGRMMRALFPNPSWPGKGIESSLPAVGGQYMPAAARGAARAAQGLTAAAQQGLKAGRAERDAEIARQASEAAAKRDVLAKTARRGISEDRYAAQQALAAEKRAAAAGKAAGRSQRGNPAVERMESEAPALVRPARSDKYTSPRSSRERSADEERMQGEGGRYAKGGKVGGASRRADGIAQRGKTRGRIY